MSTIVWLFAAANLIALAGLAVEVSNLGEFARLAPSDGEEALELYVAMRDEAENVSGFLEAALSLANLRRVVVADDGSTDQTASLVAAYAARDERVRYLATRGGKSHALAAAIDAYPPAESWMLFADADVRFHPLAANALIRHARERRVDAVTAWLRVETPTLWSLLLAPLVTMFLLQALPMRAARGTDARFSAGNGQCFLVGTDAYQRCGGHAASAEVVEDVALARALKQAGFRVALASAARIARVRGYGTLREHLRGLGRSLYYGAGPAGCIGVAIWQCALALAPLPLYVARALTAIVMRESFASVVLAPLGAIAGAFVAMAALVNGSRGRLSWRGRALSGGESAARP